MFISKKLSFFQSPSRGGGVKMSGGPTCSKVMGPDCFFSIELVVFRGFRTPCTPIWIRALALCTCSCLWPFKVTKKNEACSKLFKGICV